MALSAIMILSGCMGIDDMESPAALVSDAVPERVVMKIINNSCGDTKTEDAESSTTGSVKGLAKVIDGFGVPYDERADNYTSNPTVVTDDSYEANKERGIGYAGIEDHYVASLAAGQQHSPDHPEHEDVGVAMFDNLTTEEEQYGCAMRWEYYNPDLSGPAVDGYMDFLKGNGSGHMQYVAVHATNTDKWVICCPYDWGPALNLPTTGGGKYANGRIGGLSPAAAEALGIEGGDGPENAMTEWWWVENSSQVKCGPVNDLSEFTKGTPSSSSSSSSVSGTVSGGTATVTTSIITGVTGGVTSGSNHVAVAPANPNSFIRDERPIWQHGDLPKSKVKYIVMHDTNARTSNAKSVIASWSDSRMAAHFVVDGEGNIHQCVPINKIAHHVAESTLAGANEQHGITQERDDLAGIDPQGDYAMNAWSIGIEMVHDQTDGTYPNAQLNAVDKLITYIDKEVGHEPEIIDHKSWSPDQSDCSPAFPLGDYRASRNHNGVTTPQEAAQALSEGGCSDEVADEDGQELGEVIAETAVSLAGTASPISAIRGGVNEVPTDPRLKSYLTAHQKYIAPNDSIYTSCDRAACTAIRAAEADAQFPYGSCDELLAYAETSSKWRKKGTWRPSDSCDALKPGDVLICDGHIKIFVGNDAVRKKFPDSNANMYAASYGEHQPWCYDESRSFEQRDYGIFECVNPDKKPKPKGAGNGFSPEAFVESCESELQRWNSASQHEKIPPSQDPKNGFFYSGDVGSPDWPDMWCSEFVGWNLQNSGLVRGETMPAVPSWCGAYWEFYSAHPELAEMHANDGTYTPKPGDIILCDDVNHTEMVSKVSADGKSWEGVTGGDSVGRTYGNIDSSFYDYFVTIKGGASGSSKGTERASSSGSQGRGSSESLATGKRAKIIEFAKTQIGTPYNFGGSWDNDVPNQQLACNGLTRWAYDSVGIQIPPGSVKQMQEMPRANITSTGRVADLNPGDIVCWDDTSGGPGGPLRSDISYSIAAYRHVAIYIGNNEIIESVPDRCIQRVLNDGEFSFGGYFDGVEAPTSASDESGATDESRTEGETHYVVNVSRP